MVYKDKDIEGALGQMWFNLIRYSYHILAKTTVMSFILFLFTLVESNSFYPLLWTEKETTSFATVCDHELSPLQWSTNKRQCIISYLRLLRNKPAFAVLSFFFFGLPYKYEHKTLYDDETTSWKKPGSLNHWLKI